MALGPCGGRRRSVLDLGDLKAAMSESDHSDDESDSEDYESGEEADESQEDAQRPTVHEVAEEYAVTDEEASSDGESSDEAPDRSEPSEDWFLLDAGERALARTASEVCGRERAAATREAGTDEGDVHRLKLVVFGFAGVLATRCPPSIPAYEAAFERDPRGVFGGEARFALLEVRLRALRAAGCTLAVLAAEEGAPLACRCLRRAGLDSYFAAVADRAPKEETVQVFMNTLCERRLRWDQAMLVDARPSYFVDGRCVHQLRAAGVRDDAIALYHQPRVTRSLPRVAGTSVFIHRGPALPRELPGAQS